MDILRAPFPGQFYSISTKTQSTVCPRCIHNKPFNEYSEPDKLLYILYLQRPADVFGRLLQINFETITRKSSYVQKITKIKENRKRKSLEFVLQKNKQ